VTTYDSLRQHFVVNWLCQSFRARGFRIVYLDTVQTVPGFLQFQVRQFHTDTFFSKVNKTGNIRIKVICTRLLVTIFCRGKAISINVVWVCVCSLLFGMWHVIFSSVVCVSLPYLFTLSHKRNDFQTTVLEHKIRVLIFYATWSETFLILRRMQWYIATNVHGSSCKIPVILVRF
jgi:hypothetical protein